MMKSQLELLKIKTIFFFNEPKPVINGNHNKSRAFHSIGAIDFNNYNVLY